MKRIHIHPIYYTAALALGLSLTVTAANMVNVDLLPAYTPNVQKFHGGRTQIRAKIALRVDQTNDALKASKTGTQLTVVGWKRSNDYNLRGNAKTQLNNVNGGNGDVLISVRKKKLKRKADIVVFFFQNHITYGDSTLTANGVRTESLANGGIANIGGEYCVASIGTLDEEYASKSELVTHELGHCLYSLHAQSTKFMFNKHEYQTIASDDKKRKCGKWSSPIVTYKGKRTGDKTHDNVASIYRWRNKSASHE